MKNDNAVSKVSGQVHSYTSKVSEVSTVSEVSKMSKQGRLACTNTQGIAERNVSLNDALTSGSAMVSENISFCSQSAVQHDGMGLAKGEQQSLEFPRPLRERTNLLANECELRNSGEGSNKSALTHRETMQSDSKEILKQVQHDVPRHEATEPASFKSLVPQCPSNYCLCSLYPSANPLVP